MSTMYNRYRPPVTLKAPIKRPHWDSHRPYMLPSGQMVINSGRRSIQCEMGRHKWYNRFIFGVPILTCGRCGYFVSKPHLEGTASKGETVRTAQREMAKKQPRLPTLPVSQDEMAKAKEKFYIDIFEKVQRDYKKNKAGKLVPKKSTQ